jgi:catechol-2,3-dioxygenase
LAIERIGAVVFQTADIGKLAAYYEKVLGLTEITKTDGGLVLACAEDRHSVIIERGDAPRCSRLSFQVGSSDDLDVYKHRLSALGIATSEASDPTGDVKKRLSFDAPGLVTIDLETTGLRGGGTLDQRSVNPRKLGHVAFKVEDPQSMTSFFVEVLGFRVSDWIGDFFAFLRCGPDHHTVNFLKAGSSGLHHVAFELRDMDHVQSACDALGHSGVELIWGPGRHSAGHNVFTYHHNPDGQIVELFTQLDTMSDEASGCFDPRPWHDETPLRPQVWKPSPYNSNRWGVPRPAAMHG